jgi:hypothetical protein
MLDVRAKLVLAQETQPLQLGGDVHEGVYSALRRVVHASPYGRDRGSAEDTPARIAGRRIRAEGTPVYTARVTGPWEGLELAPGYRPRPDPHPLSPCRPDGPEGAAFGARGVLAERVEVAAWEDARTRGTGTLPERRRTRLQRCR